MSMDYGSVEIQLADETLELRPSLAAFQAISRRYNGLRNAVEAIMLADIDAIVFVIATAADRKPGAIDEALFEAGIAETGSKASEYLGLLMNPAGGLEADDEDSGKKTKGPPES